MKRMIPMTLTSALIAFLLAWPCRAQAQDEPSATQAGGEARLVHHSPQGNQDYVRMFQGRTYDYVEMDLFLRTGWKNALLDLGVNDIRSTNENGSMAFSWGSAVNLKGDFNIITARMPYMPGGLVVDNNWIRNPNYVDNTAGSSNYFKRTFQHEQVTLSLPSHPEYRLYADNWNMTDRGTRAVRDGSDSKIWPATVDRFTQENKFGVDLDISDKGQAYYEFAARKFVDMAQQPPNLFALYATRRWDVPNQNVNASKVAFRYNPSAALSVAGGATTRTRYNRFNGFNQYIYASNLSAAYRPSKNLSLTARLYEDADQIKENAAYAGVAPNATTPQGHINFLFLKADLSARYSGISHTSITAAYKPAYTRRTNSEYLQFFVPQGMASIRYQDGTVPGGTQRVQAAFEDMKHNFEAGITMELPQDVELELSDKYLMANYAAYDNMPTRRHEPSATITVPLPQRLSWTGSVTDSHSENTRTNLTNFHSVVDTFMTGLSWSSLKGQGSAGLYYTFEEGTDKVDAWVGDAAGTAANPNIHIVQAPFNYKNHVLSANATIKPIERLAMTGDASYTDSQGRFLTNGAFDPYFTGTPGRTFQAWTPSDVRILRFGLIARYELNKYVSARAGYRRQSWIDRVNSANDGRDDAFDLGLSAKF
ncbi:MAG: hypothetical protein NTY77_08635 [Elusimicrobia bacterium]|nr:hypothetical protein [Elusimicrobiota bacterium]